MLGLTAKFVQRIVLIFHHSPDPFMPNPKTAPNLRTMDLNLLVVLDVLLEEAHVTRAAERLALSQSAASNALERCRQLFGDLLLQRNGPRMKLTPRAQSLRAPVKQALQGVQALLQPATTDLAALEATVRVGMADALVAAVLGPLQQQLQSTAPQITMAYLPWQGAGELLHRLERGELDLVVSVLPPVSGAMRRVELMQEHYVVAMRLGHPAARGFNLDRWLRYPHIVVSSRGDVRGALDDTLALHWQRTRHVGVVLPSFLAALQLLEQSDNLAMLPSRSLPPAARTRFKVLPPPIEVEGFPVHMAWHARADGDLAIQHVAELIRGVVRAL